MGKKSQKGVITDKKKSRLNKTSSAEFTGFAAFASPADDTASTTTSSTLSSGIKTTTPSSSSSSRTFLPSPIYTGSDSHLTPIFKKIGQKRDALTKHRALRELRAYAFSGTTDESSSSPPPKKEIVTALSHLVFLFQSKLAYDNDRNVRCECLKSLRSAKMVAPKAWRALLLPSMEGEEGTNNDATPGLIWCLQCDPAGEVAREAVGLVKDLMESMREERNDLDEDGLIVKRFLRSSIVLHLNSILLHTRPSSLAEVYGGTKKSAIGNDGSGTTRKGEVAAPSDAEREEAEERFERVIVSAIRGAGRLVESAPEEKGDDDDGEDYRYGDKFSDGILLKHISSSRGSFRRATYNLISITSQHSPSIPFPSKLPTAFPTAFDSEKDPSNHPSLFEALLLYLNAIPDCWNHLHREKLCKSVNKQLRKACYGSPAEQWAPSMLPFLAVLYLGDGGAESDTDERIFDISCHVLNSLWEGHTAAVGPTDTIAIASAVAEGCAFLLNQNTGGGRARETQTKNDNETLLQQRTTEFHKCAKLFFESLTYYLTTTAASTTTKREFADCFARALYQFDNAREGSRAFAIQDWFWGKEGIHPIFQSAMEGSKVFAKQLSLLLQATLRLNQKSSSSSSTRNTTLIESHIAKPTCHVFHDLLTIYRQRGGTAPSVNDAELFRVILDSCEVGTVFDTEKEVEQFCMNDLLRWIILCGHEKGSRESMRLCLEMLRSCLMTMSSSTTKTVWEAFLRELVVAQCDLKVILLALSVLMRQDDDNDDESNSKSSLVDIIPCETLEEFAMKVGESYTLHHVQSKLHHVDSDDESDDDHCEEDNDQFSSFLQTCVGLAPTGSTVLVGPKVISHWVNCACHEEGINLSFSADFDNALLKTLVLLAAAKSPSGYIPKHDTIRLLAESWRQGGRAWDVSRSYLLQDLGASDQPYVVSLRDELTSLACSILKNELQSTPDQLFSQFTSRRERSLVIDSKSQIWAERAWRIHSLCDDDDDDATETTEDDATFLHLVGLGDIHLWKSSQKHNANHWLYLCLIHLLSHFDTDEERRKTLLSEMRTNAIPLVVSILVSVSTASSPYAVERLDRSNWISDSKNKRGLSLLTILGGREGVGDTVLDMSCREMVSRIAQAMGLKGDKLPEDGESQGILTVLRGVSSLDLLLETLFGKIRRKETKADVKCGANVNDVSDSVDPSQVAVGDRLWYVQGQDGDETERSERLKVKVLKIHTDDYPNLYFTIGMDGNGTKERQTVASRLKRQQYATSEKTIAETTNQDEKQKNGDETKVSFESILTREQQRRAQELEKLVVEELVRPFFTTTANTCVVKNDGPMLESVAECLQIIISRCGLTDGVGLGSLRYDVFQMVTSFEKQITQAMTLPESLNDDNVRAMRCLAIAMGLGNAHDDSLNFEITGFNTINSLDSLCRLYEDENRLACVDCRENARSFHSSALMWISSSVSTVKDSILLGRVVNALNEISVRVLKDVPPNTVETEAYVDPLVNSLLVMTVLEKIRKHAYVRSDSIPREDSIPDEEHKPYNVLSLTCISHLIRCFVTLWKGGDGEEQESDDFYFNNLEQDDHTPKAAAWYDPFVSLLRSSVQSKEIELLLYEGSKQVPDELCQALFCQHKQWCSFQLLRIMSKNGCQLYSEKESTTHETSQRRLDSWVKDLAEEEAEEAREDVHIAARWLPHQLMDEIEGWNEMAELDHPTEENQAIFIGRLLTWLTCLDFLDNAACADVRNRSSISSYIEMTGAMNKALEMALHFTNLNDMPNETWIDCMSLEHKDDAAMTPSKVGTLVVFRSVQTLPTLVKSWWNDFCPRPLQSTVSLFVQNQVAPETLRRELARITNATDLGGMVVNGSCVSREVVATYVQDECQLSVTIHIPPSFPLRNVMVDCHKTLGIAEKRWRRWALQIMRMLNSQDGNILDALLLWKQNVDKEFEGVEPCPVCYSVLCVKTHAMPNLECKTCQNRFHSSCLYKWFHSSGKSQCVLCQQPWSGTKK